MADRKISELDPLAAAPADADELHILDNSEPLDEDKNKRISIPNLFLYLGAGNFAGDIVMDAGATMDMSAGAIYVNEAVDLLATSTELNQLDGVTVGGTSAGDIVTIDGTQTLTNKTLTTPTIADFTNATHDHADAAGGGNTLSVPTIADFTNAAHDHADAAGGGNLGNVTTGDITSAAGVISMGADTDTVHILGRLRLGYDGASADAGVIAHYDRMNNTDYALRCTSAGQTIVNAASGQSIALRINSSPIGSITASGISLSAGVFTARSDEDTEHVLGRLKAGYDGSSPDAAVLAHFDHMNNTEYAMRITSAAATIINAATGQSIAFRINSVPVMGIDASGLIGNAGARITQFDDDDTMAADSSTRGVTQAAAKGYTDKKQVMAQIQIAAPTVAVTTGNDKAAIVIPAEWNGYDLVDVMCGVTDQGVTGTTDVMVHRRRAGSNVDMLSTPVTIAAEYYANDGVIDASNDDVQTGDSVAIDVDAIHSGTAPNGLFVTLVFRLP